MVVVVARLPSSLLSRSRMTDDTLALTIDHVAIDGRPRVVGRGREQGETSMDMGLMFLAPSSSEM